MQNTLALNIPQSSAVRRRFALPASISLHGMRAVDIWGRLGWRETKRRYRRTAFGPFWTTVGLAVFVTTLGLVWANLWHRDPKTYLPYLTSGMVCWVMFSTICMDGCVTFIVAEKLLRQLRISYTLLSCANVWRNAVLFFHNLTIYCLICLYAGRAVHLGNAAFHSRLRTVLAQRSLDLHAAWRVVCAFSRRAAAGRHVIADLAVPDADLLVARSVERAHRADGGNSTRCIT